MIDIVCLTGTWSETRWYVLHDDVEQCYWAACLWNGAMCWFV